MDRLTEQASSGNKGSSGGVLGEGLLATKLYAPPVRANLVQRARLLERLEEGVRGKLTLVSAPAGFGKSTLLGEWALKSGLPVGWLSLDEGDNDPTRFFSYLVAALQSVDERIGKDALSLLGSPQPLPPQAILTSLTNDIATVPEDFALVLDDFHVIRAEPIHSALAFLLEHLPPQAHFVIGSRIDPPLPLPRLRVQGQVTELGAPELRFEPEEAAAFLNESIGLSLCAEEVSALEERTEGWIAALQLAALAMRGREDASAFISAFGGSNRHVFDYLAEEVLDAQPEEGRTFLLETSVLERMCGPLCDTVTNREDGQATLARLERANLFVVPLDDERHWYRYHHLFSGFLRERLRQEHPEGVPELHLRASRWHERNGTMSEAVSYALAAKDFERAADLVERSIKTTLGRGGHVTLIRWLESLPEEVIRSRPRLQLASGIPLVSRGQFDAAEASMRDIERRLGLGDSSGKIEDEESADIAGIISVHRAVIADVRGDRRGSIEYCLRALELLAEDNWLMRSMAARNLGDAYRKYGDMPAASRAFEEAIATSQRGNVPFVTAMSLVTLAQVRTVRGRFSDATETYEQALRTVAEHGETMGLQAMKGVALVGIAELLYERNELEAAMGRLLECMEAFERLESPGGMVDPETCTIYIALAKVKQAQGNAAGALDAIQQAMQQLALGLPRHAQQRRGGSRRWRVWTQAWEARLRLAQGDLGFTERWAREQGIDAEDESEYWAEVELKQGTLARVLITLGKNEEGLRLLGRLLEGAEKGERGRTVVEVLALKALALAAQNQRAGALASLSRALTLAEPEGYVRTFADEGEPMADLLRTLFTAEKRLPPGEGAAPSLGYVAGLLQALGTEVVAAGASASGKVTLLVEPISEREMEVLRLLDSDLSNRQIAGRLFVSLDTVKTHTKHLYRKLGVSARHQAVARAKELELLP